MMIDKRTLEIATRVCEKKTQEAKGNSKFSRSLGEQENFLPALLGNYKYQVEKRGGELKLDEETVSHLESVMRWIFERNERGLILSGTVGNGKTTMLRSLAALLPDAGYFTSLQIFDQMVKNGDLLFTNQYKVLLIDDLGVEPPVWCNYGENRHPLAELLYMRYERNATTIFATNLGLPELEERYGERVVDRLKEMFVCLEYKAESYRK